MRVDELSLKGAKLISPKIFNDSRGFFLESYSKPLFEAQGIKSNFIQDNHSKSSYGTLRGLHFQSSPGQAKLIRVGSGKIFDVIVDIRPNSPTFTQWEGVILDAEKQQQLFIPVGFAHGFCVLSDYADVLYKVDSVYNGETEVGFKWDDPEIGIEWPIDKKELTLSKRDIEAPSFSEVKSLYLEGDLS